MWAGGGDPPARLHFPLGGSLRAVSPSQTSTPMSFEIGSGLIGWT